MPTSATTLCMCRHIHSMHNQDADCTLCRCGRFQATSRTSSSHYRHGSLTRRKRVARLEEGDRILVVFTEDGQLTLAQNKTGALVAGVQWNSRATQSWEVDTDLGLMRLPGSYSAHVLVLVPR
jgi:hypothetical protein